MLADDSENLSESLSFFGFPEYPFFRNTAANTEDKTGDFKEPNQSRRGGFARLG